MDVFFLKPRSSSNAWLLGDPPPCSPHIPCAALAESEMLVNSALEMMKNSVPSHLRYQGSQKCYAALILRGDLCTELIGLVLAMGFHWPKNQRAACPLPEGKPSLKENLALLKHPGALQYPMHILCSCSKLLCNK